MRIALASDVHLEFGSYNIENEEEAEVLILAGDITTSRDIVNHLDFFESCSKQFQYVVYTPGNHEHYGGNFYDTKNIIYETLRPFKNIFVLDRSRLYLDDWNTVFLTGTMWTDANKGNPLIMQKLKNVFNDFSQIENFDPTTMVKQHDAFITYLREYMTEYRDRGLNHKIVVVTHHAPSFESVHEKYRNVSDWDYNFGFASYDEEVILDYPEIKVWVHGHMHDPFDYTLGETRVICNPRGYAGYEPRARNYRLKYFEV